MQSYSYLCAWGEAGLVVQSMLTAGNAKEHGSSAALWVGCALAVPGLGIFG